MKEIDNLQTVLHIALSRRDKWRRKFSSIIGHLVHWSSGGEEGGETGHVEGYYKGEGFLGAVI